MADWIELQKPIFVWMHCATDGTTYPAIFHNVISRQEAKDICRRYELKPGEAKLRIDDLARLYPLHDRPRVPGILDADEPSPPRRMSTLAFTLAVLALLLFMMAALVFSAKHANATTIERVSIYPAGLRMFWHKGFAPRMGQLKTVDGDTLRYCYRPERGECEDWRLYGVDAPEKHVACERKMAQAAQQALDDELASGRVLAYRALARDRYGRRIVRLRVNDHDIARSLITRKLARPYDGGKRQPWC